MRSIIGALPDTLRSFVGDRHVDKAPAFKVQTYRQLMDHAAHLAFLNKDFLLFFRGQNRDYRNRADASTFYPSIYRDDPLATSELRYRFDILDQAAGLLADAVEEKKITGYKEIRRKKYIQWSILQHYEVCDTPLLDLTHSISVACSFAQHKNSTGTAFVYVFGLPYITNRISINSEHDLVNIRLLSICPPDALRPYYQDGYIAGTEDITTSYDSKTELDFRNRLIAKFEIPVAKSFWGAGFSKTPGSVLYPKNDKFKKLCDELRVGVHGDLLPREMGDFLKLWAQVEERIGILLRPVSDRMLSPARSITLLQTRELVSSQFALELNSIRQFRNQLVHTPKVVEPGELQEFSERLRRLLTEFSS